MKIKLLFSILTLSLCLALAAGCRHGKSYPYYQIEELPDDGRLITIDGIQYRRKDFNENEPVMYYNGGDVWTLADGLGEQIGVGGSGEDSKIQYDIYEAAGDTERTVFYLTPHHFYFGGRDPRLWLREDVSIELPTAETVSRIEVFLEEEDEARMRTEDSALIADLLDAYRRGSGQSVKLSQYGGERMRCSLILYHAEYPVFSYEIECCYIKDQEAALCRNDASEWFLLSEEWAKLLGKV